MNSDIKDGLYIFDRLIVSIVPITLVAKWPLDISLLTSFPTIAAACCLIVIIGYSKKKSETELLANSNNGVAFSGR